MQTRIYHVQYTTDAMSGILFGIKVRAKDADAAARHVLRTVPCAMLLTVTEGVS